MRQCTYDKVEKLYEKYCGYIGTSDLLKEGFTNRQIANLLQEEYLEKIANGYFWMMRSGLEKPYDYKPVEVAFVNEESVIVADSACYFQGFIDVEPKKLSIATRRNDRHKMNFPFEVTRHYLAQNGYEDFMKTVETKFGNYRLYDVGRSVCDCIRFRDTIESDIFDLIIENYRKLEKDDQMKERLLAYARMMKFEEKAKKFL